MDFIDNTIVPVMGEAVPWILLFVGAWVWYKITVWYERRNLRRVSEKHGWISPRPRWWE